MLTRSTFSARHLKPSHRGMFAVDITSFGHRNPRLGLFSREALYAIIEEACETAGICWDNCYHEDRGDGIVALAPADESIETLIDPFVMNVRNALSEYNNILTDDAQIQLRTAIHAGYVYADRRGISGPDVIHLFRLLQAPALKTKLAQHQGDFALIVSDHVHGQIISYSPGQIDADAFQPIGVDVKETHSRAWIWLPPAPDRSKTRPASLAGRSRHLVIHRPET
jgi:hypothetical protein